VRGWTVFNDNGSVLVRADDRSRAKMLHPDYHGRHSFLSIRAVREPWLDGDGPEREIWAEHEPCPCTDPDGCGECFEGERVSRGKTLARLNGGASE
jgi:hypothetical protein